MELFEEYKRTYRNFDRCMSCLCDLMELATQRRDKEIADIIKSLLDSLESPKDD